MSSGASDCGLLRGEHGPPPPDLPDRERVGDDGGRIPVDEDEISPEAFCDPTAVGETEPPRGDGRRRSERLDGGEPRADEELEFVVDTGAVCHPAERGEWEGHVGADQDVHPGVVERTDRCENRFEVPAREPVVAALECRGPLVVEPRPDTWVREATAVSMPGSLRWATA